MRQVFILCFATLLFGCQQNTENIKGLQDQIDKLEDKLSNTYKPGFGDFMGTIQAHHSKLWFAGINENWKLADFEVHEIEESFEAIEKYHAGRSETELVPIIYPALDSVSVAIEQKNLDQFKSSYNLLTNTCTICHRKTDHEFIKITIPTLQEFGNQLFE